MTTAEEYAAKDLGGEKRKKNRKSGKIPLLRNALRVRYGAHRRAARAQASTPLRFAQNDTKKRLCSITINRPQQPASERKGDRLDGGRSIRKANIRISSI